jgi:hypothetical protein
VGLVEVEKLVVFVGVFFGCFLIGCWGVSRGFCSL